MINIKGYDLKQWFYKYCLDILSKSKINLAKKNNECLHTQNA